MRMGGDKMDEHLEKARHDAEFLRDALRGAMETATAVESLLILQLLESVATLANGISALRAARLDDERVDAPSLR